LDDVFRLDEKLVNMQEGHDRPGDRPNAWLNECRHRVTSQNGEDGILAKALEVIGRTDQWCVEFGGWDGMHCSNTYSLIKDKGYRGIYIEGHPGRFETLRKNFADNDRVIPIKAWVGFEREDGLDAILRGTPIPRDFDVLSVDIDGNDYHVWQAVREYKPKLVVIEYNATIPDEVEFIQPRDLSVTQGTSLLSMTKLAKDKGYELIATTRCNAIFVDSQYFGRFGIRDNSPAALRTDRSVVTHVFFGYDGSVFVRGYGRSPWHSIPLHESKIQILPRWARKRFGPQNPITRVLGKKLRRFRKQDDGRTGSDLHEVD